MDLRRNTGQSKKQSEECRKIMEKCLESTSKGRSINEREAARQEEDLTVALRAEDARITKEHAVTKKSAKKTAAAICSDAQPQEPEHYGISD